MFYLIFLFCQYLRWVQYARNRVHVTCFVRLKNEFNELGFYSCKPSSLNSVCFKGNHHPCWVCVNHRRHHSKKHFRHTKKPNTQKKTKFKLQTHNYTVSFPLTLSLSLSLSVELSLTLTLSFRAYRFVAGTVTGCSRRRRCLSLPSIHLRLAQSFSLSGWRTTSQK